jgi:hypothetical protein
MQTYYKSWDYALDPAETYYVSLIFKIKNDSNYVLMAPSPVLVDPTRRMSPTNKHIVLERKDIQMHHGSYIRNNIRIKLSNSSSRTDNWNIDGVVNYYEKFKDGDKGLMIKPFEEYVNLKKVEKLF